MRETAHIVGALAVALSYSSAACQRAQAEPTTAATAPAARQHAPTVSWPRATAQADSTGEIVLLEAPRTRAAARRVVQEFFDAIRRESVEDLGAVVSEDATISSGPGSAPEPVGKVWAARFRRLDYGFTGAKQPYRSDDLGLFTAGEIASLAGLRHFELAPDPGELLAVVTTRDRLRQSGPRHFGRRIEFVIGVTDEGLRITRVFEDFRLP